MLSLCLYFYNIYQEMIDVNKKISLGLALTLAMIITVAGCFVCYEIIDGKYNSVVAGLPERMSRYDLLDEVDGIIKENYYGEIKSKSFKYTAVRIVHLLV